MGLWHGEKKSINVTLRPQNRLCLCMFPVSVGSYSGSFAFHSSSAQQSHPSTTRGLCAAYSPLCHFQGRFNARQKCANQLFWSSAHQTGLSSSSAPPVSPVRPLLLPQLIRLTVALYVWPQQLFQAFLQYHIRPNDVSIREKLHSALKYQMNSEENLRNHDHPFRKLCNQLCLRLSVWLLWCIFAPLFFSKQMKNWINTNTSKNKTTLIISWDILLYFTLLTSK